MIKQEPSADSPSRRRQCIYAAVILTIGVALGWQMKACELIEHCLDNGGAWRDQYPGCVFEQEATECIDAGNIWDGGNKSCHQPAR